MKWPKRKNRKSWYKFGKQIYNINGPEILISSKRYQRDELVCGLLVTVLSILLQNLLVLSAIFVNV